MSGFLVSSSGGGGGSPTGAASGDLGGSYPNPTVINIQGNPVKSQSLGAPQDGYTLTWINADNKWEALPLLIGPAPAKIVNIGVSSAFGVLAGSTITNTGATSVNGDIGVSPGTSIVGFPPGTFTGSSHAGDSIAAAAEIALTSAFTTGNALLGGVTVGADIGGQTLFTGIYKNASALAITGTLTLDAQGNPNAYWVFQIGSTLTTASSAVVNLINGALPANVFWLVGSSATLGTSTTFVGNILAQTSITANTSATISGRLLAITGAVTLDTNVITIPPTPSSGLPPSGPAGGDLSGFFPNPTVISITGASGVVNVSSAGNVITWAAATTSPGLTQATTPSSASGQNLTITAQAGNGSGNNGGNLLLNGGISGGGSGTKGQVQINSQILLQSVILNDGYSGATTTDASTVTIYTEPAQAASTIYDYVVTVVGQNTSNGDLYRADFAFNYQRIGSASPTVAGASPVPLNVRTTGAGNTFGGASISTAGNSVIVQVAGANGVTVHWVCSFNRIICS